MASTTESVLVSVVVPVLNEAGGIRDALSGLQHLRKQGRGEVLVVDGGSTDTTPVLAEPLADRVLKSERGRARQMNAGAREARGHWLVFLHADTLLPGFDDAPALAARLASTSSGWGFFDIALSGRAPVFRLIETAINVRSRSTGIGTGDQVLFVERHRFEALGGFPPIPLMEDVALSKRLRHRVGRPGRPGTRVIVSSRRWESRGVVRTVLQMWWLRWLYFLGVSPHRLHRRYYS